MGLSGRNGEIEEGHRRNAAARGDVEVAPCLQGGMSSKRSKRP